MTDADPNDEKDEKTSRRTLLAGVAGLGVLGVGFAAGSSTAQSSPSGEVGTAANPYLRAHVDRQVYTARTDDPADPADGTLWYNTEA